MRYPVTLFFATILLVSGSGWLVPARAQVPEQTIAMNVPPDLESSQISVKVTPGLTHTNRLPTKALRKARKDMVEGLEIPVADLRALADHGDGLAAQKYVRLLLAQVPEASASDIAYYGSIAVSTGRVWSLRDAVEAMSRLDPATEPAARKKTYVAMLYPHAWAGNSLALDAVIDLNGEGKLFGDLSEKTRQKILDQDAKNGDGRGALRLALILLQKPEKTAEDDALVRDYLGRALAGDNLAVRATAANLLEILKDDETAAVQTQ